jgi:hypothetical protein
MSLLLVGDGKHGHVSNQSSKVQAKSSSTTILVTIFFLDENTV